MKYIPTIGLEIHAELKTKSKMFCSCANDSLETNPNVNICPVCMGHPGTLPVANEDAIKKVIKVGLALNCKIPEKSKFDRKNYFYPDLPKGYQISQYDMPLCKEGYLEVAGRSDSDESSDSKSKKIRVTRVHLEEDTGSLIHDWKTKGPALAMGADPSYQEKAQALNQKMEVSTLVNFNRAGVPLMELVTEPDITNAKEASEFAKQFQTILRYLGASDADMEKGQMRVDANVSIRIEGAKTLGTKVEVKNLNSFRAVEGAIAFETKRQEKVLGSGEKVVEETRGWDENRGETFSQREKEEAHDYRYFPEPDLPPLHFTQNFIQEIKAELPELPQQRAKRFEKEYKLTDQEIEILVQNKDLGEYFEEVVKQFGGPPSKVSRLIRLASNYIINDLMGLSEGASLHEGNLRITPEDFAALMYSINEGKTSSAIAKQVLKEMFATGKDPSQIIDDRGLSQITNQGEIETIAKEIIAKNPKAAEDFKKGKENSLQFLVGQMMAQTKGTVSPDLANQILRNLLR